MISLSAPRLLTFAISFGLAAVAIASLYTRIPMIGHGVVSHRTWILVAAYGLLALGVVSKRL